MKVDAVAPLPAMPWCIVDLSQVNHLLSAVACPLCQKTDSLHLLSSANDSYGFALRIQLLCASCEMLTVEEFSSPRSGPNNYFAINELLVLFFTRMGLGHTAMKTFAALLGQKGLYLKMFQKKQHRILDAFISAAEDILTDSATAVKHHLDEVVGEPEDGVYDVTVSFDGSWHKRGHTSLYGIGAVVEITTELVLDYVVLSKYCHACAIKSAQLGENSPEFERWYHTHREVCAKNYDGSSNAMEVEAANRLWNRSLAKHGIRYTGFLGDGDSEAYTAVVNQDVYDGVHVEREECINHAHKRMGTALINLAKHEKLGGRGAGRLTKDKALYFQRMYRLAIQRNVGNVDDMRSAIWATLFHCMSTDDSPQWPHHTRWVIQ